MKTHTTDSRFDARGEPSVTGAIREKTRRTTGRASRKTASAVGKAAGAVGSALGEATDAVKSAGRSIRDKFDAQAEERYWREQYRTQPYYDDALAYEDYALAYRLGYEGYDRNRGRRFDEVADELRTEYEAGRGSGRLSWERAKAATRAAWDRVAEAAEHLIPGDSDGDGR
jgi:hypothetical protein